MAGNVTLPSLLLILLSAFIFAFLAAELFYVLWYRRRFHHAAVAAAAAVPADPEVTGDVPPSKELLLYYICIRNQSSTEATSAASDCPPAKPLPQDIGVSGAGNGGVAVRLPEGVAYGVRTVREEVDVLGSVVATSDTSTVNGGAISDEEGGDGETPFTTPCWSPLFCSPSSSPPHETKGKGHV